MATYTPNLNLKKPSTGERYDVIGDLNDAKDKIDTHAGVITGQINAVKLDIDVTDGRIDNLIATAGDGSIPSELTDIRVGADAVTYPTAGAAVREQLNAVNAQLAEKARCVVSKNLFNKNDVLNGYYIKYSTGVLTVDALQSLSNFIPIFENTAYARTTASHTTFWDKDKNYISGTVAKTFTTPTNARFMRISMLTSTLDYEQLELGSVNTAYESFGYTLIDAKEGSISDELLGDLSISPKELVGSGEFVNIFNKYTVKDGVISYFGGESVNVDYVVSDFIEIEPLTEYIVSYVDVRFVEFFDVHKKYLSYYLSNPAYNYMFATPENAKYMKINIRKSIVTIDNYMVVKGNVLPLQYVPYGMTLDWLKLKEGSVHYNNLDNYMRSRIDSISTNKWQGTKGVTFGDSITNYDGKIYATTHIEAGQIAIGYQSYMRTKLGCTVDNQGYAGADITHILNTKILPYDFTNTDFVTLTSGANDHRKAKAIGVVGSIGGTYDTATFTGAMQTAIEHILTEKPNIKIYLITPIKGWYHEAGTTDVPGPYNNEMVISVDYVNAIKSLGSLYSLPVLDWYNISGINELTKDSVPLIGDNDAVFTAYDLHPTQLGFYEMGNSIVSFLNNN